VLPRWYHNVSPKVTGLHQIPCWPIHCSFYLFGITIRNIYFLKLGIGDRKRTQTWRQKKLMGPLLGNTTSSSCILLQFLNISIHPTCNIASISLKFCHLVTYNFKNVDVILQVLNISHLKLSKAWASVRTDFAISTRWTRDKHLCYISCHHCFMNFHEVSVTFHAQPENTLFLALCTCSKITMLCRIADPNNCGFFFSYMSKMIWSPFSRT